MRQPTPRLLEALAGDPSVGLGAGERLGGGERRLIGVGELKLRLLGEELFEQLSSTLPLPLHCLSRQVMKRGRTLDERGTRLEVKIAVAENGCSN